MKVLHIPNYFYPHIGGIEQVCRDCANALAIPNEYEQKIICFNSEKKTVKDVVDGFEITRVGSFTKIASQSLCMHYGKELKKLMKEFQPDIVIFHYPNPFVAHYLGKFLKKRKFKFILWWHLDITKQKLLGKLFEGQTQKLLRLADKIVATSPNYVEGSKYLSANRDKCVVIPNCVDNKRLAYDDNIIAEANKIKEKYCGKTILFGFGRHVEYKGLTYLVKASKLLNDDYAVLIGGAGPLTESLKEEAKDDSKVVFLGKISDEELKATLLACDIFCFPSITKNEAFGIALAEAMYYAKPAITFTIPGSGVNYVNLNGVTGLEANNSDAAMYADKIKQLGQNQELREEYGNNAKKRVENLFLQETFNVAVQELIKSI